MPTGNQESYYRSSKNTEQCLENSGRPMTTTDKFSAFPATWEATSVPNWGTFRVLHDLTLFHTWADAFWQAAWLYFYRLPVTMIRWVRVGVGYAEVHSNWWLTAVPYLINEMLQRISDMPSYLSWFMALSKPTRVQLLILFPGLFGTILIFIELLISFIYVS